MTAPDPSDLPTAAELNALAAPLDAVEHVDQADTECESCGTLLDLEGCCPRCDRCAEDDDSCYARVADPPKAERKIIDGATT